MMRRAWTVTVLALGMVGCASPVPTGTPAAEPQNPAPDARSVQATQPNLTPEALKAVLPERIPAAEVQQRLVRIDPSLIKGLGDTPEGLTAPQGADRTIQQRGFRGGGIRGFGGGWGGRGWYGGFRGYGWRGGWGGLRGFGYYPYASYYYPYAGYYYPYYYNAGYYYPYYYPYAGAYYSPLLYPYRGYYYPYSYYWY